MTADEMIKCEFDAPAMRAMPFYNWHVTYLADGVTSIDTVGAECAALAAQHASLAGAEIISLIRGERTVGYC